MVHMSESWCGLAYLACRRRLAQCAKALITLGSVGLLEESGSTLQKVRYNCCEGHVNATADNAARILLMNGTRIAR